MFKLILAEVFGQQCAFCHNRAAQPQNPSDILCGGCLIRLREPRAALIENRIADLPVFSCYLYDSWLQAVILANKRQPSKLVIHWLERLFCSALESLEIAPEETQIIWVPSASYGGLHLVEALALALTRNGFSLPAQLPFKERNPLFWGFSKMHQGRSRSERQSLVTKRYQMARNRPSLQLQPRNIVLIDDVCTSGATLFRLKDLLACSGLKPPLLALTLAFTPESETSRQRT